MKEFYLKLKDQLSSRALVIIGIAAVLGFVVLIYGVLQQEQGARDAYRHKSNVYLSFKGAYNHYQTSMLMPLADVSVIVDEPQAEIRFAEAQKRLEDLRAIATNPDNIKALSEIHDLLPRLSPGAFRNADRSDVVDAMSQIRSRFLGIDIRMAQRGAELSENQSMHLIAEGLMGIAAISLLFMIGKILISQSNSMQVMRVEKDTQLAAIETSRDGIVILDNDGRIIFMNRAFALLHYLSGLGRKDSIGMKWSRLYDERSSEIVRNEILPAARDKGFWHGESNLVNARGQTFTAHLSLTALPDGGFIGTAQDTREKREREKETEDLRLQYYQAQKMESLGRLAGGIAHDFNNILAAITGYGEFLTQDLEKGSPTHGFAEKILMATSRAKGLIEQILTFSRTNDKGKTELNMTEAVAEVIAMLRASLPSGISIDMMDAGETAYVSANPTQMSQALMNLCVNAQDAMEGRGRLNITLDTVEESAMDLPATVLVDIYPEDNRAAPVFINSHGQGRTSMVVGHVVQGQKYARLSVSDTGAGIPRHVMEHMFEPFFTTKQVNKGTGLGLAAVHGIVMSHRGLLSVDTTIGKGTVFSMMFPVVEPSNVVAEEEEAEDTTTNSGRILVIDDHDDVRTTTCEMLQRAGFEAFDSKMPSEALDLIRDNPQHFDLVITDYSMPEMTGMELVTAAAAIAPGLRFILISGYAEAQTREKIDSVSQIKDVIKKPVTSAELVKRVKAVLAS